MSHPPIIVVTFALPQESSDFRRALRGRTEKDVQVEHIGVGPAAAAQSIDRILSADRPRLIICAGFAGGLDPELAVADLVVAENLTTPDVLAGVRSRAGTAPHCRFGGVVSRAETVETVEAKSMLHQETGALAVDMESETVAAACRAAGVPLLVVRTISDAADAPLPVPFSHWFDLRQQRPRQWALVKYLLAHPDRIGPFAGFVRGLAPARRSLAEFLLYRLSDFQAPAAP
jgi:adenosylhomocysteine nucleosidase